MDTEIDPDDLDACLNRQ
jgi:hypothetical protein